MKTKNKNVLFICLIVLFISSSFMLSIYAISFIGSINYIGPHGGIVKFDQSFEASSLGPTNNLNHFINLIWGGNLRGNLGFDADTDVNMTITDITRDTVSYTVTTALPGNVKTYLYYYRQVTMYPSLSEPSEVTGGNYTYSNGITTITTTGSPIEVSVTFGSADVSNSFVQAQIVLIGLMGFLVLTTFVSDINQGTFGMGTVWKSITIVALLGALGFIFRGWGY